MKAVTVEPSKAGSARLDDVEELAERLLEVLEDGARFLDFLVTLPEVHEGDVLRALGELRERGDVVFTSGGIYRRSGAQARNQRDA